MHLHALEGSWLDHPFWKTKFVLREQGDLDKLIASGVQACWIDSSSASKTGKSRPSSFVLRNVSTRVPWMRAPGG